MLAKDELQSATTSSSAPPGSSKPDSQMTPKATNSAETFTTTVEASTSLELEPLGPGSFKEPLGHYQRISVLTCLLLTTIIMFGLSAAALSAVEIYDFRWQKVINGQRSFPKGIKGPYPRNASQLYFEGKMLRTLPIGKLIYHRRDWVKHGVDYGMDRDTSIHFLQIAILFVMLGICVTQLILSCFFRKLRQKFQWISLGYGFIGLFMFFLVLMTLYFAFLHKVSAYLQNALDPPLDLMADNKTIDYFVNLCYACAFAFSIPNKYAAKSNYYSKYWPFPSDGSFTIENITYSKYDLMELGLCTRQDYMLVSTFLLAITMVFCWKVASYSEAVENRIQGPPVWLQRFRVKVHKGMRHWKRRKKLPTHMAELKQLDEKQQERLYVDQYQSIINAGLPMDQSQPTWEDAYDVLDGGKDHVLLLDMLRDTTLSTQRLYSTTSKMSATTRAERNS